jgi:hypothetical protein
MSRALCLLPDPEQADLTDEERSAIRARNTATLKGRCACGASVELEGASKRHLAGVMAHEAGCPATDEHMHAIAARLGRALKFNLYIYEFGDGAT